MNLMNEMKFMVAFELIKYLEPLQPFNLTHSISKSKVFDLWNENGVDWAGAAFANFYFFHLIHQIENKIEFFAIHESNIKQLIGHVAAISSHKSKN